MSVVFPVSADAPVREKLLAKAKEFIVENGIQNLSHERLAKVSGISKGACLHYFPTNLNFPAFHPLKSLQNLTLR